MRKFRVPKKTIISPLGKLDRVPYLYTAYQCCTCKKYFSFLSGFRCDCEKHHKFKAKAVFVNEIRFPSFKEATRYSKLSFLEKENIISDLELQPVYPIIINEIKIGKWIGDFKFTYNGTKIVEDVKGKETDVFKLKKKIIEALYPGVIIYLT